VARTQLFSTARPNITKLAVLVTDGKANPQVQDTQRQANLTKAQDVEVFTIGITSDVSCFHTGCPQLLEILEIY